MRRCGNCGLDQDSSQFNRTHRWCADCRREYNRLHRPRQMAQLRVVRTTRDEEALNLPPITMVYRDEKGGMLCGRDKERLHFIGTAEARGGKEIRFWCPRCLETAVVPEAILGRIAVWEDDSERDYLPVRDVGSDLDIRFSA